MVMAADPPPDPLDAVFETLLDQLEAALELCTLPDRNGRLEEIAALCAAALAISQSALKAG